MIKAVIFDFFGVLVTERFKHFRDTFFPGDQKKWHKAIDLVKQHDSGHITKLEYQTQLAKLAAVDLTTVEEYMNTSKPNKQLIEYIKNYLKPNYKLGVLSNSGDSYINQILGPEDLKLFDDILLSYKTKFVKPQSEIYELAAERLGVLTTECVFVDDSPSQCEGARRVGMKTIVYEDFPSFKKELEAILPSVADN